MPCIALRWKGNVYLFDVGECCQRQLMKYRVGYGSIKAIFISHLHLDHFLGIFGLVETLRINANLERLFVFSPKGFSKLSLSQFYEEKWDFVELKRIRQGKIFEHEELTFTAFRTEHIIPSYGFVVQEKDRIKFNEKKAKALGIKGRMFSLIKERGKLKVNGRIVRIEEIARRVRGRKIVYSSDTAYNENIIKFAKDADVAIFDSTFGEEKQELARALGHSTTKDAAMMAKKAGVKMLVLNHISARYKKEDEEILKKQAEKYFDGKVVVARDGLKIEI